MADAFADKTKEQVRAMTDSFQAASDIPLALCCDEEGGTVVRVSRYPALAGQRFQSPQQVFARGGMDDWSGRRTPWIKLSCCGNWG